MNMYGNNSYVRKTIDGMMLVYNKTVLKIPVKSNLWKGQNIVYFSGFEWKYALLNSFAFQP